MRSCGKLGFLAKVVVAAMISYISFKVLYLAHSLLIDDANTRLLVTFPSLSLHRIFVPDYITCFAVP